MLNQKLRGRALMRTLFFAPYILSEVVTGVVWRQILRPSGLLDQTLESARRQRPRAGVARQPRRRALQPVLRHLVEVLRFPHGDPARRAATDSQRAQRGGGHRRRFEMADASATSRSLCSGRRCASRSSCRSSAPSSCSTSSGSPPRVGRSTPHRRWRPTSSTRVSDAGSSATRAPSRSSSSGCRSSSRCCTSGSRCAATFEGLVSLAELTTARANRPVRAARPAGTRLRLRARRAGDRRDPTPVRDPGRLPRQRPARERSSRPARSVDDDELPGRRGLDDVLAPSRQQHADRGNRHRRWCFPPRHWPRSCSPVTRSPVESSSTRCSRSACCSRSRWRSCRCSSCFVRPTY